MTQAVGENPSRDLATVAHEPTQPLPRSRPEPTVWALARRLALRAIGRSDLSFLLLLSFLRKGPSNQSSFLISLMPSLLRHSPNEPHLFQCKGTGGTG